MKDHHERKDERMKLTTTAQVSVDGVMQGPGGPEEDERGVFERGGWAHFDNESGTAMDDIYRRAGAFLFGFAVLWTWVRFMRHLPHLLSHHMAPRASEEHAAIAAAD